MIIVAIDETNFKQASNILSCLNPKQCMIKIGSVSFNSFGHDFINYAAKKGFDIFLDLKLHDIPNTVKKSIQGLTSLPIKMLTIHISGGEEMLKSSREAVEGTDIKIFGVTALTSLSDNDTKKIYRRTCSEQVNAMLDLAESSNIHGVVCSPHEIDLVKKRKSLKVITPGIRMKKSNDDQKRIMLPREAIELGADFIVIGRPITKADNIKESLHEIYESIK